MNSFNRFSAPSLGAWSLAVLGLTVFTADPYLAALSLLCGVINLLSFRLLRGGRVLILPLVFIVICALADAVFSHRGATELLFINDLPITLESLASGATTGAVLGAATLHCILIYNMLDDSRLLELLGNRAPKTALVLSSAMHFLPELSRRLGEVSDAQTAIGRMPDGGMRRLKGNLRVWSSMLSLSFEDAASQAALMRARGLTDGRVGRRSASPRKYSALRSTFLIVITSALFIICILGIALGLTDTQLIPRIALPRDVRCVPVYLAASILMLIPAFIKLKGACHGRS